MARVAWTKGARKQLQVIADYLDEQGPNLGEIWLSKLTKAPDILERFPEIGSPVEDAGFESLRELLVGPYRMIYAIKVEVCLIVTIFHSKQNISRILAAIDPLTFDE